MSHLQLEELVDLEDLREAMRDPALAGPPESLTWAVSSLSALEPEGSSEALPHLDSEVSIRGDTAPRPFDASFRYTAPRHRDIRVESDEVDLDISVDPPSLAHDLVVMGRLQVKSEAGSQVEVQDVPIHLLRDGRVIVSTLTNRFGDFHIETKTGNGIELAAVLRGRGQIRLSII